MEKAVYYIKTVFLYVHARNYGLYKNENAATSFFVCFERQRVVYNYFNKIIVNVQ